MRLVKAFSFALVLAAGCAGDPVLDHPDLQPGDGGLLPFAAQCVTDDECVSGLCTKISYERKPAPVCTYRCDPADTSPSPSCPDGCNAKGYCKIPS